MSTHGGLLGGGDGDGDGGGGDGSGGLGDGGGGDGEGGNERKAVWQTNFLFEMQFSSSHWPVRPLGKLPAMQCWAPRELSGWPGYQLVYDSGVLDGLHTHVPSDAASVPPIHT